MNQLRRLQLVAQHVKSGAIKGERRSTKRGQSIEFADYRDYVAGDDLRQLDWNIYARLDRPFIKLMEDEEDLAVYLVIDGSGSMGWGEDDTNKFTFARRLAAGLGVISLFTGDLLQIELWGNNRSVGPMRGQANLMRMLDFLEQQSAQNDIDLLNAAQRFNAKNKRAGFVIFISDLLLLNGYQEGLKRLQSRGHEIMVLHTLSPEEIAPTLSGDVRLIDIENGETQDVSMSPGIRDLYIKRVQEWQTEIQDFCRDRKIRYFPINTNSAWDEFILYELRKQGVVA